MLKRNSIFYLLYILFLLPKVDDLQTYWKFHLNYWLIKVVIDLFFFLWCIHPIVLIWLLFLRLLPLFITSDYPTFLELCSQRSTSFTLNCFLWPSSGQSSHSVAGRPVHMGWQLLAQQLCSFPLTAYLPRFMSSFKLLLKPTTCIWVHHLRGHLEILPRLEPCHGLELCTAFFTISPPSHASCAGWVTLNTCLFRKLGENTKQRIHMFIAQRQELGFLLE